MILTVIIPLYNTEQYIERCIISAENQDIPKEAYELIVVNDGSTDNGREIVLNLKNKYPNIQFIEQKNQGLGATRNNGLKYAKGKYVMYLDSDDFIEENCLSRLIEISESNNLDVLVGEHADVYDTENGLVRNQCLEDLNSDRNTMTGKDYVKKNRVYTSAWKKLFRREFLLENGLFNRENVLCEDIDFAIKVIYLAKRVKYEPFAFYNYFIREGSITFSANMKREMDLIEGLYVTKSFFSGETDSEIQKGVSLYVNNLILYVYRRSEVYTYNENKKIFTEIKRRQLLSIASGQSVKNICLLKGIALSPVLFAMLLEIRRVYGRLYKKIHA